MKDNDKISIHIQENEDYIRKTLKDCADIIIRPMILGQEQKIHCLVVYIEVAVSNMMLEDSVIGKLVNHMWEMPKDEILEFVDENGLGISDVKTLDTMSEALAAMFAGNAIFFFDGYPHSIKVSSKGYPNMGVQEASREKVLRGSKDGFVETVVFNTALIRRRIRSNQLCMEMHHAGNSSQTDIVLCYMNDRVDHAFLSKLRERIDHIQVDALTMNQESLAECIYPHKWYNPFPKFRFSERPDTAAASILEGNIIILVDNSPSAMILPSSIFDIIEEADDYYFPPITGTYLRLSRMLIFFLTLFLTPLWLLFMQNPGWIPEWLAFIQVTDDVHVALIFQLLILEFAIDGLRLAAVNTPSMLTTPLSVIAGIVLGEYSVKSGWFNSETMLYMAFVTIANYSQTSFELGYALKFMRVMLLLLTAFFNLWGFIAGTVISVLCLIFNKTIAGKSYIYPLVPFSFSELKKRLVRNRLPHEEKRGS